MDYSCGFGPGFGGSLRRGGNIRKSLSVSSKYIGGADYVLRTQLAEQLKCMDGKWEMDTAYLNDLIDFYKKRSLLEQEYSDALSKLVQGFKQKLNTDSTKRQNWPKYSYHGLLNVLLDSSNQTAVAHQVTAEIFSRQMTQRLQDLQEDCTRAHKQTRELAQLCQATVLATTCKLNSTYRDYCNSYQIAEDARKTLDKSKEKFDRECKRAQDKNKDLDKSQKIRKLKDDFNQKGDFYTKQNIQTLQSRNEYLIQIAASNASVDKYFGQELYDLLNCLNLGFHNAIVRAGLNHISCEKSLANSHRSASQTIESLVQTIDPNKDQLKFLNKNQSAFNKTSVFAFQTIKDDIITCVMSHSSLIELFHSAINNLKDNINESKSKFEEFWKMSNEITKKLHKLIDLRDYDVEEIYKCSVLSNSKNGSRSNLDSISTRLNESQTYLQQRSTTRNNRIELERQYFEQFSAFIVENHHYHVLNSKLDSLKQALSDSGTTQSVNSNSTLGRREMLLHSMSLPTSDKDYPPVSNNGPISPNEGSIGSSSSTGSPGSFGGKVFGRTLEEYVNITQQAIPPLIASTVKVISVYGTHNQGIFRISSSQSEINEYKELYDKLQDPFYSNPQLTDANLAASLFKMYFRELKEPIFTGGLFHKIVDLYETERDVEIFLEKVADLLNEMTPESYVVMRYLFGFFKHLTHHKDKNMMDSYNLAICLGPCLMPIPTEFNKLLFHMQAIINEIIRLFIENHDLIFTNSHLDGPIYQPLSPNSSINSSTHQTSNDIQSSKVILRRQQHHQMHHSMHQHQMDSSLYNPVVSSVSNSNIVINSANDIINNNANITNNNGAGVSDNSINPTTNQTTNRYVDEYDEAHSTLTSQHTKCSLEGSDTLDGSDDSSSSSVDDEDEEDDEDAIEEEEDAEDVGASQPGPPYHAIAIADFQGQTSAELSFQMNERLVLDDFVSDHWWHGRKYHQTGSAQSTGGSQEGLIPLTYVQMLGYDSSCGAVDTTPNTIPEEVQHQISHTPPEVRSTTPIAILQVNHHDQESHYLHIGPPTHHQSHSSSPVESLPPNMTPTERTSQHDSPQLSSFGMALHNTSQTTNTPNNATDSHTVVDSTTNSQQQQSSSSQQKFDNFMRKESVDSSVSSDTDIDVALANVLHDLTSINPMHGHHQTLLQSQLLNQDSSAITATTTDPCYTSSTASPTSSNTSSITNDDTYSNGNNNTIKRSNKEFNSS